MGSEPAVASSRSASEAVEAALDSIAVTDGEIHAWAYLDPERAREAARSQSGGPLAGLSVGVKDIFDTADQPTAYGSPIYAAHRPEADAAVVTRLLQAGAAVIGKTVTTEFAWITPGPTTNPRRHTHTPGGSSSGSAAAVASGMVDLALGTQTAGSVIRPASFCGVLAMKPTFGVLPTAGMKQIAPSLDTVGLFARNFEILEAAWAALAASGTPREGGEPTFALVRTDQWDEAEDDCRQLIEQVAADVGAEVRGLADEFTGLAEVSSTIQEYEGARSLAWESSVHRELLSPGLRALLETGQQIDLAEYETAIRLLARVRGSRAIETLFGPADIIITPAATGEAPEGLASTGSPQLNRIWTLIGCPALNVPGLSGSSGLPIGVQLVARPFAEPLLIESGRLVQSLIGRST